MPNRQTDISSAVVPITYEAIVDEIASHADLPRQDVAHRVWQEALQSGWNVARDVQRFGVTPHVYSSAMETLYRHGDGFIFETLVYWARPSRQAWSERALERLRRYAVQSGRRPEALRVLMLGDGSGNDTLFLAAQGFQVHYFDVPGSKTFAFAAKRFQSFAGQGQIQTVPDYDSCLTGGYDAVWCFDVLEHLPDPPTAIHDLARMMRPGGIALVTEDFREVGADLPTHLRSNLRYAGQTPFLFLNAGLHLTWYEQEHFKPMEFVKPGSPREARPSDWVALLRQAPVRRRSLRYVSLRKLPWRSIAASLLRSHQGSDAG